MNKHTPGPWMEWNDDIKAKNGSLICNVYASEQDVGKSNGRGESDYNARLIAAAPELLDALNALVHEILIITDQTDQGRLDAIERLHRDGKVIENARHALARATGGV